MKVERVPGAAVQRLLAAYQARVSPHLQTHTSIRCVYEPSCSEYMRVCVAEWGALRGITMGVGRLARCRPGHGGVDHPKGRGHGLPH